MDELIDTNKFYCVYGLPRWWTLPLSIQYNTVQTHVTYKQNVHWSLQVICLKRLHSHIWGHPTFNQLYPAHQRHDLEKVNVMGKLWIDSPVWILAFIGYVYYIFILKNGGRYHEQNRPKSHQVIYRSEPWILPKWKRFEKLLGSYRESKYVHPSVAAQGAAEKPLQKHEVTHGNWGDLITAYRYSWRNVLVSKIFCSKWPENIIWKHAIRKDHFFSLNVETHNCKNSTVLCILN